MTKCLNAIKAIDKFGTIITFRISDDHKFHSLEGGLITILFIIFSLFLIILKAIPFVKRQNINLIYTNKIIESPVVNLLDGKWTASFGLQYASDAFAVDEEYYNYLELTMKSRAWIGDDDISDTYLNLKECEESDFYHKLDDVFDINGLGDYYCPDTSQYTNNFTLEGTYTDDIFIFLSFEVKIRDDVINDTAKMEELRELMNEEPIEMAIFFPDTALNYENKKNPLPIYLNYVVKGIEFDFTKKTDVFLSLLEFKNDQNLLIENPSTTNKPMLDYSEDSFFMDNRRNITNNTVIGEFIIKASPKQIQVSRSYQKLTNFIADSASILAGCFAILLIVSNVIGRFTVDLMLIKEMLKYKGKKNYDVYNLINSFNELKQNLNLNQPLTERNIDSNSCLVITKANPNFQETESKNILIQEGNSNKNSEKRADTKGNGELNKDVDNGKNIELEVIKLPQEKANVPLKNSKENETNETTKDPFDFGIYSLFCYLLFGSANQNFKMKREAYYEVSNGINHYLDIVSYVKKMLEIEALKSCLLEGHEKNLLNFLSKPAFNYTGTTNTNKGIFDFEKTNAEKLEKEEIDILLRNYLEVYTKKDKDYKDKQLLSLFDSDMDFLSAESLFDKN